MTTSLQTSQLKIVIIFFFTVIVSCGILLLYEKQSRSSKDYGNTKSALEEQTFSDWNTYTNSFYHFSFKYRDLEDRTQTAAISGPFDLLGTQPSILLADTSFVTNGGGLDEAIDGFAVYVEYKSIHTTFSQFINVQKKGLKEQGMIRGGSRFVDKTQESFLNVNNQHAVFLSNTSDGIDRYFIPFPDNQHVLVIGNVSHSEKSRKRFSQILSTLTFLPQKNNLEPAKSQSPAAGVCNTIPGHVASVVLNVDVPSPRCIKVTSIQLLQIINKTKKLITFTLGYTNFFISPYSSTMINQNFGTYFAPGIHTILFGSLPSPEIWLQ